MIRYSQQDPQWKNKKLGTGEFTIGQAGCFLTCFSMLLEIEPDKVNDRMVVFGGFIGADICPGVVPSAYPVLYFENQVWCQKTAAPMELIDSALANGKPVIVQIDTSPVLGIQSHFVIVNKKVGNDYQILDPWPLVDSPAGMLLARYGKGRKAAEIITYIAVIGGIANSVEMEPNPPATTEPQPISNTDTLTLITTKTRDLRLRTSPGLSAPIICKLPLGITLTRNPEVEVIKDGYRWNHVDLWIATGKEDGTEIYAE